MCLPILAIITNRKAHLAIFRTNSLPQRRPLTSEGRGEVILLHTVLNKRQVTSHTAGIHITYVYVSFWSIISSMIFGVFLLDSTKITQDVLNRTYRSLSLSRHFFHKLVVTGFSICKFSMTWNHACWLFHWRDYTVPGFAQVHLSYLCALGPAQNSQEVKNTKALRQLETSQWFCSNHP